MAFKSTIDLISDGEVVNATNTNVPLIELQNNDNFLLGVISGITTGSTLLNQNVVFASGIIPGNPVYYNSTNAQYEGALAASGYNAVAGVCYTKSSNTAGNILIAGYAAINLSGVAVNLSGTTLSGSLTIAGRYFLTTNSGGLLSPTRPTSGDINSVLVSDGLGNVTVFPQDRDIQGAQGPAGSGAQGPAGPPGYTNYVITQYSGFTAASGTVYLCNATSGSFTITLPAASGKVNWEYTFKKTDSTNNTITIVPSSGSQIDGQSSGLVIAAQYNAASMISDNTNWWLI